MSYSIIFTNEALEDALEAQHYYEGQQAGLGLKFAAALKKQLIFIADFPEGAFQVREDRRRSVIQQFHYNIIYSIDHESQTVFIIAVMHGSRSPRRWENR